MRKPKDYKRSYKILVNFFVIITFSALSIILDWSASYYMYFGAKTFYYVLAVVSTLSAAIIAEALTVLAMTGFHRLTTKDILNTKRKKAIFILTSLALTLMMLIINCCLLWYLA